MGALPRGLQAQSSHAYLLQQSTLFHGYKEFELQAEPLGLKSSSSIIFGLIIVKAK